MATVTELHVNGSKHRLDADPERSLLFVLRNDLHLTGAKYGCGEGRCGACTVLLDGKSTRACITPVRAAVGKQIRTIEGLEQNGQLHPLQEAFVEADAMQCGYCTAGMMMSALALLEQNPNPTEPELLRHMHGNICRCCTYARIHTAIRSAGRKMKGESR